MSLTWRSEAEPDPGPIPLLGWVRVAVRGTALFLTLLTGVVAFYALRAVERPIHGAGRPWTPHVTQSVCRVGYRIFGIRHIVRGHPMRQRGAVVSNHGSWLDIFTLNAVLRVTFVSKAEVAGWPGIGFLARTTGTVFITRNPRDAPVQRAQLAGAMRQGQLPLFFPEGTSTDGRRVLPFKSSLFAAVVAPDMPDDLYVQPVSVTYRAPQGADPRFYGWWGDMDFGPHAVRLLAQSPQGQVTVVCHPPLRVADFPDRKTLAAAAEAAVRAGFGMSQDRGSETA